MRDENGGAVLEEIRCWLVLGWRLTQYGGYRLGICSAPNLLDIRHEAVTVFGRILNWPKTLRVVHSERCPQDGPAVFASNHMFFSDPLYAYNAIVRTTDGRYKPFFMMRDDFFKSSLIYRTIDVNTLVSLIGAYGITRDNVTLPQLKRFLRILANGDGFIMFPGRTRSRSGVFMEYRDDFEDPGGVSFFIAHAQRRNPDVRIPAIPMARTLHPVTEKTAYVFGDPFYLEDGGEREVQRAFDFALTERMSLLVELNVPQILAAIVYLRCLHNVPEPLSQTAAATKVRAVLDSVPHYAQDPASRDRLNDEIEAASRYFASHGLVTIANGAIVPHVEKVLSAPPLDFEYRKRNPLKFLVNQIIHLADVVEALEKHARG